MRVAGFAFQGFVAGAAVGFLAVVLFVNLWMGDMAPIPHSDAASMLEALVDGLSMIANIAVSALVLALLGGVLGAIWFARRAHTMNPTAATAVSGVALIVTASVYGLLI